MRKLYGWKYFEALEKSGPQIGRSIIDTTTSLTAGERSVAATLKGIPEVIEQWRDTFGV